MSDTGTLLVCGTPIGNLGDISDRLRDALRRADVVFAEDTRRTATLLRHVEAAPPVRSFFIGNEGSRSHEVLSLLEEGKTVALVTDAGMPVVSDPGSGLVREARSAGHTVTVVPGPSAVTMAVAASGLGGSRFAFEGFLPRKGAERSARLAEIAADPRPVVLFVSPHRLRSDLEDIASVTGPEREVFVARELTKLHEEGWAGTIAAAVDEWSTREPKGEFTIVLAPGERPAPSPGEAVDLARSMIQSGTSASEAARAAARETGVPRREIYQALIEDQPRS